MQKIRYHQVLIVLVALGMLGCSSGPKLVPVTGKVTFKGKPIKNVRVTFHPDPDQKTTGPGSSGVTDENGNFTLSCSMGNKPGAIVGLHRVIVEDLDVYGNVFVGRGNYRAEDDKKSPTEVPKNPRFNPVYSDLARSTLKQEVKGDMAPVTIELK